MSSVAQRFWAKVRSQPEDMCWEWAGSVSPPGYGHFRLGEKQFNAHRVAWFLSRGIMPPPELKICHICDNRLCVNPDHLFCGSQKMNMVDAAIKGRVGNKKGSPPPLALINSKATHCKHGHPLSGDNLRIANGKRCCKTCALNNCRRYRAEKKVRNGK